MDKASECNNRIDYVETWKHHAYNSEQGQSTYRLFVFCSAFDETKTEMKCYIPFFFFHCI